MRFDEWITQKYIEWRGDAIGREGSVSAFARWVDVPQSLMVDWMQENGKVPRSAKAINALVSRFGGEVYDVLGITPAVDIETENAQALQEIDAILKEIPRNKHAELTFAVRAWAVSQGYIVDKKKSGDQHD